VIKIKGTIDGKLVDLSLDYDADGIVSLLWQLSEKSRITRLKAAFEALVKAANELPGK
jgi:hypothetical protein